MATDIPFVQHVFDSSNAEASVLQLAPHLFRSGHPSEGRIRVKTLTEGTTNAVRLTPWRTSAGQLLTIVTLQLFKASYEKIGSQSQVENVLVKVYGEGTEITIDRNSTSSNTTDH
jgi:ethanolamine kinase